MRNNSAPILTRCGPCTGAELRGPDRALVLNFSQRAADDIDDSIWLYDVPNAQAIADAINAAVVEPKPVKEAAE